MQAVVLVGGFGTRLRPLTNVVPKSMLPVAHVPLIVRLIGQLERGGVDHVTLALGFLPEPFVAAFPDGRCGGVELDYAIEPEPLDTGGAIRFAADHAGIDATFVVANGDVLTDLALADLVAEHRRAGAEATIHLTPVSDPSAFGVAEVDEAGRIVRFVEKPAPGTAPSNLINAGTYVFEPSVLERIATGRRVSIERDVFPRVAAGGRFHGMATDDYWIDAGQPELYLQANLDLVSGRRERGVCRRRRGGDGRSARDAHRHRRRSGCFDRSGRRGHPVGGPPGCRRRRRRHGGGVDRGRLGRAGEPARSHGGRCRRQDCRR